MTLISKGRYRLKTIKRMLYGIVLSPFTSTRWRHDYGKDTYLYLDLCDEKIASDSIPGHLGMRSRYASYLGVILALRTGNSILQVSCAQSTNIECNLLRVRHHFRLKGIQDWKTNPICPYGAYIIVRKADNE